MKRPNSKALRLRPLAPTDESGVLQDWERCPKSGFRTSLYGYFLRSAARRPPYVNGALGCRQAGVCLSATTYKRGNGRWPAASGHTPLNAPSLRGTADHLTQLRLPKDAAAQSAGSPAKAPPNLLPRDKFGPEGTLPNPCPRRPGRCPGGTAGGTAPVRGPTRRFHGRGALVHLTDAVSGQGSPPLILRRTAC